jgi:hypothetical protein
MAALNLFDNASSPTAADGPWPLPPCAANMACRCWGTAASTEVARVRHATIEHSTYSRLEAMLPECVQSTVRDAMLLV